MTRKKTLPPTYFLVALVLTAILHFVFPIKHLITYPYNYFLGIILLIIGIWLMAATHRLFEKNQTTIKPFEESSLLITTGPYRFSRHPMYLASVIILLAISFFLGSLSSFLGPIIFLIIMDRLFIVPEEKMMTKTFGQKYLDYKRRVRRWL